MSDVATTRRETTGSAALWFGVLAGPLAWSIQLAINADLEEFVACTRATEFSDEVMGVGVKAVLQGVNGLLLAVTLAALAVSILCRKRLSNADDSPGGRASWMSLVGMFNGVLFALIIAVGFVPPLVLDPCRPTL